MGGSLLVEYRLPASSSWCDVVLLGRNNNSPTALILELKHWDTSGDVAGPYPGVITHQGSSILHPNPQLAGKQAVDSWIRSQTLRDQWEIKDSNLVNQIMEDFGLDHRISHMETLKVMESIRKDWIAKHYLDLPLEHYAKRLDSLGDFSHEVG